MRISGTKWTLLFSLCVTSVAAYGKPPGERQLAVLSQRVAVDALANTEATPVDFVIAAGCDADQYLSMSSLR